MLNFELEMGYFEHLLQVPGAGSDFELDLSFGKRVDGANLFRMDCEVYIALFIRSHTAYWHAGRCQQHTSPPGRLSRGRISFGSPYRPDVTCAEIGEDESAVETRESVSSVDGPADNRASMRVVIIGDRQDEVLGAAGENVMFETDAAFHNGPAIVLSATSAGRLEVYFLTLEVARVRQIEVTAPFVEGESPWIAKAQRPDFRSVPIFMPKGIIGGYAVRQLAGLDVDAEKLAEQGIGRLPSIFGIARESAVTTTDVQEAVLRTECQVAAVVVLMGLVDSKDYLLAVLIGTIGVVSGGETANCGGALTAGVTHVKVTGFGIGWREGQSEHAALAFAAVHALRYIQKRRLACSAILDYANAARQLNYEDAPASVTGVGYADRKLEPRSHFDNLIVWQHFFNNWDVRLGAEDTEVAPGDPAWTVEGQYQDFVDRLRGIDWDGEDLAVLGVDVCKAFVESAETRPVPQPDLMSRGARRGLRDDHLYSVY